MTLRFVLLVSLIGALVAPATTAAADHLPPNGYFSDDDGNIHERNINALAASGITKGCNPPTNDRFCPDNSITRAEMATFLNRALSLPASSTDYFDDDDDSVHESAINAIREARITVGCRPSGEQFCPTNPVTRGQMAAFLVRSFDLPASANDYFSDDDSSVFENDINALALAGITVGCATDVFCVDREVTRAEMATFLTRAIPLPIPILHDTLSLALPFSGVCDDQQLHCQATLDSPVLDEYLVDEGWFYRRPFATGDESLFASATFEVTLDGIPVDLTVGPDVATGATTRRSYTATIGALAPGVYVVEAEWIWDGTVLYSTTLTLNVD